MKAEKNRMKNRMKLSRTKMDTAKKKTTVYSRSVSHGVCPNNSMGNIPIINFFFGLFPQGYITINLKKKSKKFQKIPKKFQKY